MPGDLNKKKINKTRKTKKQQQKNNVYSKMGTTHKQEIEE